MCDLPNALGVSDRMFFFLLSRLHLAKVEDIPTDVLFNFRLFCPVVELTVPIYVTPHCVKWLKMLFGFIVTLAHLSE